MLERGRRRKRSFACVGGEGWGLVGVGRLLLPCLLVVTLVGS